MGPPHYRFGDKTYSAQTNSMRTISTVELPNCNIENNFIFEIVSEFCTYGL